MIAEQYAFFPALNATLNGTSAVLLLAGRILIARGRDAADVAISTAFGANTLESFRVWTDQVA